MGGGSDAATGACWAASGWSTLKYGLLGASESGPLLAGLGVDVTCPEGLIVGVLVTGAATFGRFAADGGTAMGWI